MGDGLWGVGKGECNGDLGAGEDVDGGGDGGAGGWEVWMGLEGGWYWIRGFGFCGRRG